MRSRGWFVGERWAYVVGRGVSRIGARVQHQFVRLVEAGRVGTKMHLEWVRLLPLLSARAGGLHTSTCVPHTQSLLEPCPRRFDGNLALSENEYRYEVLRML